MKVEPSINEIWRSWNNIPEKRKIGVRDYFKYRTKQNFPDKLADVKRFFEKLDANIKLDLYGFMKSIEEELSEGDTIPRKFSFSWAGCLKDLKKKYTSVEIQHKALEWR